MSSTLNLQLLVKKLQKIADWFMLGVHLGVPKEELNKIDQQFIVTSRCGAVQGRTVRFVAETKPVVPDGTMISTLMIGSGTG